VNELVQECRSEWRRLGVPDALADEMAAELEADLEEAAADGVPIEDVLGSGARDPRAFAAGWAAERGVVGAPIRRRSRVLPAVALLALVLASVGAVLVIVDSGSEPSRVALSSPFRMALPPNRGVKVRLVTPAKLWIATQDLPRMAPADAGDSGNSSRTVGVVLLVAGLAGLVPLVALSWVPTSRAPRTAAGRP
jgi:hypothetical protein